MSRLLPLKIRAAVNVLNLSTPFGLLVARLGGATTRRGPRGLIIAEGYRLGFPIAGAFTVGNVIVTSQTIDGLARHTPEILQHEDAHSWQWFALGPLFLPAYLAGMAWSLATTRTIGLGNPFERHAGLISGGYVRPCDPGGTLRSSSGRSGAGPSGSAGGAPGADAAS